MDIKKGETKTSTNKFKKGGIWNIQFNTAAILVYEIIDKLPRGHMASSAHLLSLPQTAGSTLPWWAEAALQPSHEPKAPAVLPTQPCC